MDILLIIILILILVGGIRAGGRYEYLGGGIGTIIFVILILWIMGVIR